jgi:DNA-binding NarL/FixJ family response regulator
VRVAHSVPLIGSGISAILARSGEFEVVASHTDSSGHAGEVSHNVTDVLIADAETGVRALGSRDDTRNVLIVTQDDGEPLMRKALEKGARGILLHTCEVDELTTAVKTLSRGGTAFAPLVTHRILQSFAFDQLSERELEVLQLMVQGCSGKDMARKLLIAPGTVKSHVRSILTKLGAARRAEAVAIAHRRGIARLDSLLENSTQERKTT